MRKSPSIQEPLVERRRTQRARVATPIQFRNVLRPEEPFKGSLSRDLSGGGVSVSAHAFVPKEARLVLLLSLPDSLKPIRVIGRVAWMRQRRFSEGYDLGIQFIEALSQDQERIADCAERALAALPSF
ncbi:MAG: PilZ domain-containing protein [Candidatus Omnitrophica bacterium]|nr:PilZ domain-containing protein [Candidatus Omnitrophota bacterium]